MALMMSAIALPAAAANIETLLMPGKVIEGHAKELHPGAFAAREGLLVSV